MAQKWMLSCHLCVLLLLISVVGIVCDTHKHIHAGIFRKPSELRYQLKSPLLHSWSQVRFYDKCIMRTLGRSPKENGSRPLFFVESGGFDGETFSISLALEKYGGWSGLLIEPNPYLYEAIIKLNRKCYAINAALSLTNKTGEMSFTLAGPLGGITETLSSHHQMRIQNLVKAHKSQSESGLVVKVPTFPLEVMLRATANNDRIVDYWALDTEGSEPDILASIDFKRITVGYMTVEHNGDPEKKRGIVQAMEKWPNMVLLNKNTSQLDFEYYNPNYFAGRDLVIPPKPCQ